MKYRSDRQAVEAAIPAILLHSLCATVRQEDKDTAEEKKAYESLCEAAQNAALKPFRDILCRSKATKLFNRAQRAARHTIIAMVPEGETLTSKLFLTWHAFTEQLIQEGLWDEEPTGDFAKAFKLFNDMLFNEVPDEYSSDALNKSARKQARRWRDHFISQNYYHPKLTS